MKTFHIKCPPYAAQIDFCITESKEVAREYFSKNYKIDVGVKNESVTGYCLSTDQLTAIWLPKIPEDAKEFGTLHHELYHAVRAILKFSGVRDLDEPYAYLLGYVVSQFYLLYPPLRKPDFNIMGTKVWMK